MPQEVDTLLYLSAAQVRTLIEKVDPVAVAEETLLRISAGRAGIAPETALRWTAPDGTAARSLVLPAWSEDSYGCKIINACIGNLSRGMPRAQGLILLHDAETAVPICVMEGATISALRTAAVSIAALRATDRLLRTRTAALLGCGQQARMHLELLAAHSPALAQVAVFDQEPTRAVAFAAQSAEQYPALEVIAVPTAEQAVREADVTIAVTTTTTAYVPLAWLRTGATFVNVSLDDAEADLLLGADHLFVDDWDLITADDQRLLGKLARAGRATGPREAPRPGARRVDADLAALIGGGYDRAIGEDDRVAVNPFGMGAHDVALATRVFAAAVEQSLGTMLDR